MKTDWQNGDNALDWRKTDRPVVKSKWRAYDCDKCEHIPETGGGRYLSRYHDNYWEKEHLVAIIQFYICYWAVLEIFDHPPEEKESTS